MSEAKVENMMNWMCRYYLDLNHLSYGIPELLADRVITQVDPPLTAADTAEVYGGPDNIVLLRRIREALLQDPWNTQTIEALTPVVNNAQGPLFFRLIKIMYQNWNRQRDEFNARSSSDESSSSSGEDDDPMDTHEFVRRTGVRRLPTSAFQSKLAQLKQLTL